MAKRRIDEIYDLSAINAQHEKVMGTIGEMEKRLSSFKSIRLSFEGADSLKKLKTAQDEYANGTAELDRINKQLIEQTKKLDALRTQEAQKLQQIKIQQQELNKANKEAAKDALGLTDAYSKLAKEYEKAARTAQNMIIAKGKDDAETKKAIATAQKLGQQLKDTDAQVLKFQRNVGNYANSLGDGFELVRREITRLQVVQKDLSIGGDTRGAEAAGRQIRELDNIIKISYDDTKSFDKVVKELQRSYANMANSGQQSNEFLKEYKKFVAESVDKSRDLKEEIRAMSSDTRRLDLMAGSVSFIADSFQLAAGAAQLAGASEEDAAKATAKLVAIQSVANGLKGIANELTTKGTAANKAYALVQGLVATAMDKTAASGARLKASLGLLGLAITVIGAIAIAYAAMSRSADAAAIRQQNLNDVMKESGSEYAKAVQQVNEFKINIDLAKKGTLDKKTVLKEYNETLGKATREAKNLDEAEQNITKNGPAYIQMMFSKAKATAALAKAAALALEADVTLENDINQKLESFKKSSILGSVISESELDKAARKELILKKKSLKNQINELIDYAENEQKNAAAIAKSLNINLLGGGDKTGSDTKKDIKKTLLDTQRITLEREAEIQKEIVDIESFGFESRINALREYVRLKTEIINAEAEYEKKKKGTTQTEINLIETKRLDDIFKLGQESSKMMKTQVTEAVQQVNEEMTLSQENQDWIDAVSAKDADKWQEEWANFFGELTKAQKEAIDALDKEFAEQSKLDEIKNVYIDTFQSIAGSVGDILSGIYDGQKNKIQEQIDLIDQLKAAEIDRINASGDNEEKKAARIKIVEAKAQADRETLERKQRQLDRQKAVAAKALNVFQITIDGIQAINKQRQLVNEIILKMAIAGPAGKLLFGPSLALAQAMLIQTTITTGAAIAAAAAAPIPKFAKGKTANDAYDGPGIVGEAGRELGISTTGQLSLFTKPTLTHLMKGDVILPNKITEDVLAAISLPNIIALHQNSGKDVVLTTDLLKQQIDALKRIERKSGINIYARQGWEFSAEYQYHMKR